MTNSSPRGYRDAAPLAPLVLVPPEPVSPIRDHGPLNKCPECACENSYSNWHEAFDYRAGSNPVAGHFCSEARRRRFGFLWLRRCKLPGTHTHQFCRRCRTRWFTKAKR
jgi:hypothetical protein